MGINPGGAITEYTTRGGSAYPQQDKVPIKRLNKCTCRTKTTLLILITVTFSTPTGVYTNYRICGGTREGVMPMLETVLKGFEEPDDVRTFEKGKFELVRIGGMSIGRATYEPGWKWSVHVGPSVGAPRCNVEHVGLVLSGCATAAMEDGTIHELRAGMLFYIPPGPPGHDSWVVGDVPYVSLHFLGADHYANK
jgi:hypothetical protein